MKKRQRGSVRSTFKTEQTVKRAQKQPEPRDALARTAETFDGLTATVRITADHTERACGIPEQLASSPFVDLRFKKLPIGDYIIDERVVIERKSGTDFPRSITDNRLFRQASRLAASRYRSAVILEGPVEDALAGVSREAIQGALISLTLIFDIPVLRSTNKAETARLLIFAAKQLGDLDRQSRPFHPRQPKTTKGQAPPTPPSLSRCRLRPSQEAPDTFRNH